MNKYVLCTAILFVLVITQRSEARVNSLQPYCPGIDITSSKTNIYLPSASIFIGEETYEIPAEVNYSFNNSSELGLLWGLKGYKDKIGISDLQFGCKYVFMDENNNHPGVIGEAAVTLPAADYKNQLGTGGVGLKLFWAMKQKIETLEYFMGLGAELNSENADKYRAGNIFGFRIGAQYIYDSQIELIGEIKGFNHSQSKNNGIVVKDNYQELYLAPGINYKLNGTNIISGALLIGLTPESHDIGIFGSMNF